MEASDLLKQWIETTHYVGRDWEGLDAIPDHDDGRPGWDTEDSAHEMDDDALEYVRRGPGSFQNPGGFAPAGEGVDYPGQYPDLPGALSPPQPWQLRGRDADLSPPRPMEAEARAVPGGMPGQLPGMPQGSLKTGPEGAGPEEPEKDPTDVPDAYAGARVPPVLAEAGLDAEDVEQIVKHLGPEGLQDVVRRVKEGEDVTMRPVGRPKKPVAEPEKPKRGRGRPRKGT